MPPDKTNLAVKGSDQLGTIAVVLHGRGIGLRIHDHSAIGTHDGHASARRGGHSTRLLAVERQRIGRGQREHAPLARQLVHHVLDVSVLRHFSCQVIHGDQCQQEQAEHRRDQFQENPAGQVEASNR